MNIFIGHETALEYWRSISLDCPGSYPREQRAPSCRRGVFGGSSVVPYRLEQRRDFLPVVTEKTPSFAGCRPSLEALGKLARCGIGLGDAPVDVLVSSVGERWDSTAVRCHVQKAPYPRNSFVRLDKGIYIASPELVFVQMAQHWPLSDLLLLGFELCGIYTTWKGGYGQRPPLSTLARMSAFVDKASPIQGVVKARRAVRYVAERSASPKESVLALLLGLPRFMGGYGLGVPCMNWEVSFTKGAKKTTSSASNYVDLCWPSANLAVEYDSDLHTGSDKIADDAARRNALFAAGMHELTVTKKQLFSVEKLDKVAHVIARHLGIRLRSVPYNEGLRRMRLRQSLLHSSLFDE